MNEFFFCIGQEHVETGEFLPEEIGQWAVRLLSGGVLILESRHEADQVWANIAHHGYAHN